MKTYTYQFVDGNTTEIEIDEKWYEVLKELDRIDYNNNQKETRRHVSLDNCRDHADWLSDEETVTYIRIAGQTFSYDDERFAVAIRSFTDNQYELFEAVYCEGMSIKEYALAYGISERAASKRNRSLIEKIKEVFE